MAIIYFDKWLPWISLNVFDIIQCIRIMYNLLALEPSYEAIFLLTQGPLVKHILMISFRFGDMLFYCFNLFILVKSIKVIFQRE